MYGYKIQIIIATLVQFLCLHFFLHSTTIFNVGPRNLNASTSKKGKKKVGDFLVDEDDDIEVIDDGEEEKEELLL